MQDPELLAVENSGERMVPEISGGFTFWEHVYRYAFACRFVRRKRVLDIACGEGYGAAALRRAGASNVIGIDVAETVCAHARHRYGVDARTGRAEQIPIPGESIDVVVSFETIEHLYNPGQFLAECARVLVPGGVLVISTPNRDVYSAEGPSNPYHCSEMDREQFVDALRGRFVKVKLHSQHPVWAPAWSIRTLAADDTPWKRVRLLRRLRFFAALKAAATCPSDPSLQRRKSVVDEILAASMRAPCLGNPYAIRPWQRLVKERPSYFVATAARAV